MPGRNGNLDLLVGAILLSALGDWLALTALSLHLEEATGSGAAVTALFIATWMPLVLGGVLVTTIGARWTLLLAGAAPAVAGAVGLAVHRRRRPGEDVV